MQITAREHIHVDGGWTVLSYLKLTTDTGLVGWAEYSGHQALPGIIEMALDRLGPADPCNTNAIDAKLHQIHRPAPGGLSSRAMGAIANACLDIRGKAEGVPVYELLGGAIRSTIPLYWSHVGLFRANFAKLFEDVIGTRSIRGPEDFVPVAAEAAERGFTSLKTNLVRYTPDGTIAPMNEHLPHLNVEPRYIDMLVRQLEAIREGAGPGMEILLDLNFNYKAEGYRQVMRAIDPLRLGWAEMDMPDPQVLSGIRGMSSTPIASLEMQLGRRAIKPFLDAYSVDVAIVDPQWNGVSEAMKMAALADIYDVNVAAHCSAGPLGALISAHFCAAVPNLRIMEHEVDVMPWHEALLTEPNTIERGKFVLSDRPGWGADIDEEIARAHPGDKGPSGKRGA